jgi:hypothetical protein
MKQVPFAPPKKGLEMADGHHHGWSRLGNTIYWILEILLAIYPGVPSGGGAGSSGACFLFGGREMDRTKWMDDAVYVHL